MDILPDTPRSVMLHLINEKRRVLIDAMLLEPRTRHFLWQAQEELKRVEDEIAREIWQRADLKNDRDRNAAKHLARINDERYIKASEMVQRNFFQVAEAQADIIIKQNELAVATAEYEYTLLGRRDALVQFIAALQQITLPDTTTAIAPRAASTFTSGSQPAQPADPAFTHETTDTPTPQPDVVPVDKPEFADYAGQPAPNGYCNTCGQPRVIAEHGIRKGKPVHGDKFDCPANAGSMMHWQHPDFFKAVDDKKGLVNTLAPGQSTATRFEQRRETPSTQADRERREARALLADQLLDEGKVGWAVVGATQHFFGVDGNALGVEGHKAQITLDGQQVKLTRKTKSEITACDACKEAATLFMHGMAPGAAYGRADEDAVLLTGAATGEKKSEKIRGIRI